MTAFPKIPKIDSGHLPTKAQKTSMLNSVNFPDIKLFKN